jgi:two-component system, chemotaxis family, chemotaxis protein CheY
LSLVSKPPQHRLLVVDDSRVVRNRIARLCTRKGFSALTLVGLAGNGEDAINVARQRLPTLVTMDLTMPGVDGEGCIKVLSKMLPETRILVVSALADKATALRAIRCGAHGFVHKPFRDDQLADALLDLME